MTADPIIDEVRRLRRDYAEQFGFDIRAMAADLRRREQRQPERVVAYAPKPARRKRTA